MANNRDFLDWTLSDWDRSYNPSDKKPDFSTRMLEGIEDSWLSPGSHLSSGICALLIPRSLVRSILKA